MWQGRPRGLGELCTGGTPVYALVWKIILACIAYYDPAHIPINQAQPYMRPS